MLVQYNEKCKSLRGTNLDYKAVKDHPALKDKVKTGTHGTDLREVFLPLCPTTSFCSPYFFLSYPQIPHCFPLSIFLNIDFFRFRLTAVAYSLWFNHHSVLTPPNQPRMVPPPRCQKTERPVSSMTAWPKLAPKPQLHKLPGHGWGW